MTGVWLATSHTPSFSSRYAVASYVETAGIMDKETLMRARRFWMGYGMAIAISVAIFSAVNFLWSCSDYSLDLQDAFPYAVAVYLLAGSGLALALLYWAMRAGRLDSRDLGLDLRGWATGRRLAGVAVIVLIGFGQCLLLNSELAERRAQEGPDNALSERTAPTAASQAWAASEDPIATLWSSFCYWFVLLLPASLAELLVFLGMGYCLLGRGLAQCGMSRLPALAIAAAFSSAGFGLFHYTYPPVFHSYAFPLMAEMLFVVLFFVGTRNFYLTLALHNAFAATGFMHMDFGPEPNPHPPLADPLILGSFVVPFLALHWLEWRYRPERVASEEAKRKPGVPHRWLYAGARISAANSLRSRYN